MKRSKKDTLISIVILLVFFIQLKRGFNPPELEPGMIPGGLFPALRRVLSFRPFCPPC